MQKRTMNILSILSKLFAYQLSCFVNTFLDNILILTLGILIYANHRGYRGAEGIIETVISGNTVDTPETPRPTTPPSQSPITDSPTNKQPSPSPTTTSPTTSKPTTSPTTPQVRFSFMYYMVLPFLLAKTYPPFSLFVYTCNHYMTLTPNRLARLS